MPTIVRRDAPTGWRSGVIIICAALLSLWLSLMLLPFRGQSPAEGFLLLIRGPFGSGYAVSDCLVKAIPIYLCSLGVAVAFRLKVWNIGAEGQFAFGAVGTAWMALTLGDAPSYIVLPAMLGMAMLAGGLLGLIPALLKLRFGANEIIVTLMLNYIAILFLQLLVYGPWKDPTGFGFPMTPLFSETAILGEIGATGVNHGLWLCVAFGLIVWVFLDWTKLGFELKASGESVRVARYARLPYNGLVVFVMVLSGALAGAAGFVESSATLNRLQPSIMVGYGYTAIVVAWLARLNPFYIAVAAIFLAGLRVGGENLQLELQVPAAFAHIMEGLLLLTVLGANFFITYRLRFGSAEPRDQDRRMAAVRKF